MNIRYRIETLWEHLYVYLQDYFHWFFDISPKMALKADFILICLVGLVHFGLIHACDNYSLVILEDFKRGAPLRGLKHGDSVDICAEIQGNQWFHAVKKDASYCVVSTDIF